MGDYDYYDGQGGGMGGYPDYGGQGGMSGYPDYSGQGGMQQPQIVMPQININVQQPQYPQQGYPAQGYQPQYQAPVGRMDASGYVKYTRQQMLDGLRNYVIMQTRMTINKEEKILETPQVLRHACAECGVSKLQMLQFRIPEAGISIPFYFCTACGKLYYYKDFAI